MARLRPTKGVTLPDELKRTATPLLWRAWAEELRPHPDRKYTGLIVDGIRDGFRIGFDYANQSPVSAAGNLSSARQYPQPVEQYLARETGAGRVRALPAEGALSGKVHISRCGVIPKPHQPGKWRLIVDLSSPKGTSVNDGIAPSLCSVSYASVEDAISAVMRLGQGSKLAKFDLENAYRLIPVHPDDRPLLGIRWKGVTYIDGALPFGLRSAPKLFTAVADALLWIMGQRGVREALHYLDDFLVVGPPGSERCGEDLQCCLEVCRGLGVAVAPQKTEGPSTRLTFLGIEIDTMEMVVRLPRDKLVRLRTLIGEWKGKKCCRKRQLLSLIGLLQHASKVVRSGRTFLRRMIDLSMTAKEGHHWLRLNKAFQSDLLWWDVFLEDWNGVSAVSSLHRGSPSSVLTTDASGGWGGGAFSSQGEWFNLQWPDSWRAVHITIKELAPIVIACAMWGPGWRGKTVLCRCDNAAVVAILRSGTSKHPMAMHLMRCLFFFTAFYQIYLVASHLPGKMNTAADALSRGNPSLFLQLVPEACRQPSPIPNLLLQHLILSSPDWTSTAWTAVLRSILA